MKKTKYLLLLPLIITLTACTVTINTPQTEADYVYEYLMNNCFFEETKRELIDGMIYGITDAINDPYTYYTSAYNNESQDYSSSGVGLGFSRVSYYGECLAERVMKSSPAEIGGLKAGDIITDVRDIGTDSNPQVGEMIHLLNHPSSKWADFFTGNEGEKIELYIKRKNDQGIYTNLDEPLIVKRGYYNVDKVTLMGVTEVDNYVEAYIKIHSFLGAGNESTPQEELKYVFDNNIFNQYQKVDHMILDLRGNGGGYVNNCVDTLGLFIPKGQATGYYQYKDGTYEPLINNTQNVQYTSKIDSITLIVDQNTASAGEAFVTGLRDSEYTKDKVHIAGRTSFGKGVAQTFLSLFNDGSLIRYTFAITSSPSKITINKRGIVPDLFTGVETIPYEEEIRFIEGVESNDQINETDRKVLLNRFYNLLGKSYESIGDAVLAFTKAYKLDETSIYSEEIANKFQDRYYTSIIYYYPTSMYEAYVEGKTNNDDFTPAQRRVIREQISLILEQEFVSFDKAVKAFQEYYSLENEDHIYDKATADKLNGLMYDYNLSIYEGEVLDTIRQTYGR